jgi:hypothetical protein
MAQVKAEDQFLVDEGKAYAEIIIRESPARSTRLAAAELQTYVAEISGARLPISAEPSADVPVQIYVGESPHAAKLGNAPDGKRSHLSAFVSDDDGTTWSDGLLLDERESSYPDGVQAEDGTIYIIYDHQRYTLNRHGEEGVGSVQMAVFREDDIRAGKPVSDESRLKIDVTRLRKEP